MPPLRSRFKIVRVGKTVIDKAQRGAAVYPFTGPAKTSPEIIKALRKLVHIRQASFFKLFGAGWQPQLTPLAKAYLLQCPPPACWTKPRTRFCKQFDLCPFCWARERVLGSYRRFEYACYEGSDSREARPFQLLEIISCRAYPRSDPPQDLLKASRKSRASFLRQLNAEGAFILTTVEPSKDQWTLTNRVLAVMRPSVKTPLKEERRREFRRRVTRHERISRGVLARALARVCKFPSGMLQASAEDVLEVLEARKGLRLSSYTGLLRNKSARRREKAWEQETLADEDSGQF